MTVPKWGGSKAATWVRAVLERYGRVCWLNLPGCTVVATSADHVIPRSERLDLQYVVSNGRPACLHCNQKRGKKAAPARPRIDQRAFFTRSRA